MAHLESMGNKRKLRPRHESVLNPDAVLAEPRRGLGDGRARMR
jgi:hypothetical protein